jgi:hypothetical protein
MVPDGGGAVEVNCGLRILECKSKKNKWHKKHKMHKKNEKELIGFQFLVTFVHFVAIGLRFWLRPEAALCISFQNLTRSRECFQPFVGQPFRVAAFRLFQQG